MKIVCCKIGGFFYGYWYVVGWFIFCLILYGWCCVWLVWLVFYFVLCCSCWVWWWLCVWLGWFRCIGWICWWLRSCGYWYCLVGFISYCDNLVYCCCWLVGVVWWFRWGWWFVVCWCVCYVDRVNWGGWSCVLWYWGSRRFFLCYVGGCLCFSWCFVLCLVVFIVFVGWSWRGVCWWCVLVFVIGLVYWCCDIWSVILV